MGDNKTSVCLPLASIEYIRIWAVWQITPGDNSPMEKIAAEGLFTSGLSVMGKTVQAIQARAEPTRVPGNI